MRAAQIEHYGGPLAVNIQDVPVPQPAEGQMLVQVHAASLNPFDTMVRAGYIKDNIPLKLPVTLGGDIAGVVNAVGAGVTDFTIGDKVYGQANVVAGNSGAFAEYAVTDANQVGRMSQNTDFLQAASLPLVGVSALQALVTHLNLQPEQKVFIHGGAGGIGAVAIQIAKHIGAYVATTATGDSMDHVSRLGADQVIDYKTSDFATILHDYDAVFDTVGGDDFTKSLAILKEGGTAVSMTAQADEATARSRSITAITQSTHVTTVALDELRQLIEAGVVTPYIGRTYPLEQVVEAFIARESGAVRGKIVLEIHKD